jgi:hypothetical protein
MAQLCHIVLLQIATVACSILLVSVAAAHADEKPIVEARLSLSTMFLTEGSETTGEASNQSVNSLLYVDLRAVVGVQRLSSLMLEGKGDLRLRLTGNFDENAAFAGNSQITSRGYSGASAPVTSSPSTGGREYDLRELWIGRHGEKLDFALGRLIVREADALTIDGLRGWWRFLPEWHGSLFAGFYPSPFARSLTEDYTDAIAVAGGFDLAYQYPRIWGAVSAVGAYLGGPDDGGPINPASPAAPSGRTEDPRVYATWTNYVRITDWLDFYHDLVVDLLSSAGLQLTRADATLHLMLGRLRIDAGYAHLSSLAVELYLHRLLMRYDRANYLAGTIENNLIIQRTSRDEARLRADVRFWKLDLWGEGRFRRRALLTGAPDDPNFANVSGELAGDVTAGVRDDGDLAGLRIAAWFGYLYDYRAATELVDFSIGRDFWDERIGLDLEFLWEGNHDFGGDPTSMCPAPAPTTIQAGCYGHRNGMIYEGGVTFFVRPAGRWFILADYRLVDDTADGQPAILTHVGFLRVEARFK